MSTTTTPCENPTCPGPGGWGWQTPHYVEPSGRSQIEQPARGRKRRTCSDACRKAISRENVAAREREAAARALEQRHQQRIDQVERVIRLALADEPKLSGIRSVALAERITRALRLAHLIDLGS